MSTASYNISGMTCDHCVNSVRTEIGKLSGVTDVAVELSTGHVTITSATTLDEADVIAAIDEAGYAASQAS